MSVGRIRRAARLALVSTLLVASSLAGSASAQETRIGRSVSTSRSLPDWKAYFSGHMRELTTRSTTTTVYDAKDNPPVRVGGVDFNVAAGSPVESEGVSRYVALPADPDFGTVRVETRSRNAKGEVVETSFSFKEKQPRPPLAVGPLDGQEIHPSDREQQIAGKTFRFRTTSRTKEIVALLVAPTFEDLIAGRSVREVREPGARLEEGSLRVVSPAGDVLGYYAGDVRTSHGEDFVTPR